MLAPDPETGRLFMQLLEIVAQLRGPDGCPWDREQTIHDLARHLQDELDEVKEAIRNEDRPNLAEELGDLLFNLVFVAEIARGEGWFRMEDVLTGIRDKIVRRHPDEIRIPVDIKIELVGMSF